MRNRTKSRTRARVEHPFLVLKRLWGFAKVRYRGLAKNANRAFTALAKSICTWLPGVCRHGCVRSGAKAALTGCRTTHGGAGCARNPAINRVSVSNTAIQLLDQRFLNSSGSLATRTPVRRQNTSTVRSPPMRLP